MAMTKRKPPRDAVHYRTFAEIVAETARPRLRAWATFAEVIVQLEREREKTRSSAAPKP